MKGNDEALFPMPLSAGHEPTSTVQSTLGLAARMRPQTLDDVLGQEHLLAPGRPLRELIEGSGTASVILFGPPGSGKTTLARLITQTPGRLLVPLPALNSGVKEIRAVVDEASQRSRHGTQTVVFIDEIHRFARNQQDALLAAVEEQQIILVAATTENPSFSVVAPLLSRSIVLRTSSLGDGDILRLLQRAVEDPEGLNDRFVLTDNAARELIRLADGDARAALTTLEACAASAARLGENTIDVPTIERARPEAVVRYDQGGDHHHDVVSAFIKSIRGSDPDAALHYLARMVVAGEDPRYIARRLIVHASEDVGLADPTALNAAVSAAHTVDLVGMPDARLALAQATVHCAMAPKSNALIRGIDEAITDVRSGGTGDVPPHLRFGRYAGAKDLGHSVGYKYPHAVPDGVLAQQYPPDPLVNKDYYRPTVRGLEKILGQQLEVLRRTIRAKRPERPPTRPSKEPK